MRLGIGLGLNVATSMQGVGGGAPATPKLLAYGTPLIVIGPSIQNVINTRAPRNWLMGHAKGHFYPTPGNNQAVGGCCATIEGATKQGTPNNYYEEPTVRIPMVVNQLGDATVISRGKCLVFYDPGPNDYADFSTSLVGDNGTTPQKLKDAVDRWITRVTAAGHMIALAATYSSNSIATNAFRRQACDIVNAYMATKHNPALGIFYCGTRLTVITDANQSDTTLLYDGLHPTAKGADLIGFADYTDLLPYFGVGTIFKTTGTPFGQAGNTLWNMPGTGGTLNTGTSGSVATGWSATCSTSSVGVGSSISITAVMSKGTRDFTLNDGTTINLPCQIVDVVGTPSADGFFRFESTAGLTKGAGGAANFNWGEFGQSSICIEIAGSTVADPVGVAGMGDQFGLLGGMMNKTPEANAKNIAKARQLVFKSIPVQSLKLNGAQKPEFALAFKNGVAVDVRLYIACLDANTVETVAYAAPFNLSALFPTGSTNPLTRRPDLTGTKTVGSTLTANPPCISGGGAAIYGNSYIKDGSNNIINTWANNANPSTYVLQAGDSGKTIRMTSDVASNGYGSLTVDDGPTYAIP